MKSIDTDKKLLIHSEEQGKDKTDLKKYEEYFRSVVGTANDAIITINSIGNVIFWNRAAEKIFGYTSNEILGKPLSIIIPQKLHKHRKASIRQEISTYTSKFIGKTIEIVALRKDGTEFPGELSISTWKTREGTFITGIIRDITERKISEENTKRNYQIQNAISSILRISLEHISLKKQLELILRLIISIPWLTFDERGSIFLVEKKKKRLVMKVQHRLSSRIRSHCEIVPFGHCLCGRAASSGRVVFADCIDERHDTHLPRMIPHGHYCVPIISAGKILGVINLYVKENHERDKREEEFLDVVAKTLAGIIERKSVEEKVHKAKRELESRVKVRTRKLNASLEEKEILLSEIHHRVKNNLQIVSSLLELQLSYIKNKKYIEIFKDCGNRIQSMAIIHEELYNSKDLAKIDFKDYINDLMVELFASYGVNADRIALKTEVNRIMLGIDTAIPCGLIINEIVSNSIKYAFPDNRKGEIFISLKTYKTNDCILKIRDSGTGLPKDLDIKKNKSLGMYLVTNLIENQLYGRIKLNRARGTEYIIRFKKKMNRKV